MAASRRVARNASKRNGNSAISSKYISSRYSYLGELQWSRKYGICLLLASVALSLLVFQLFPRSEILHSPVEIKTTKQAKKATKTTQQHAASQQGHGGMSQGVTERFQTTLSPKMLHLEDRDITFHEVKHNNKKSSVRVYLIDNVLTDKECDGLCSVHSHHVIEAVTPPIFCFDSADTLHFHLRELSLAHVVEAQDFTNGTSCLNESMSARLKPHFKFSYSTAFYPGESKFSTSYGHLLERITGLNEGNGGKFQITSYGQKVGYKSHLDCVQDKEKRDRFATALVYLQDVKEGGETVFPQLNISVTPKKGRMLLWNSMDKYGNCDPTSLHHAAPVVKGHKFILQRWYYYQSFPNLGKRSQESQIPERKIGQPRVHCDNYQFGSCRWYDEWGYEHLAAYNRIRSQLK